MGYNLEISTHALIMVISRHLSGGPEQTLKHARLTSVLTKIQNRYHLNTSLEHYHHIMLFSDKDTTWPYIPLYLNIKA
jgi:hypothetical protein